MPLALVPILQRQGHDVDTVEAERLTGRTDEEVMGSRAERAPIPYYPRSGFFRCPEI